MKLGRLTRLLLGCIADVMRSRRCLAEAWRLLRRSSYPAAHGRNLSRWQACLARAETTLVLSWECCQRSERAALP